MFRLPFGGSTSSTHLPLNRPAHLARWPVRAWHHHSLLSHSPFPETIIPTATIGPSLHTIPTLGPLKVHWSRNTSIHQCSPYQTCFSNLPYEHNADFWPNTDLAGLIGCQLEERSRQLYRPMYDL
ncbi:hypothetical protein XELAEV_18044531mg [Xenopus laevis]|uniref:Uncharacterized protein n=1 Tax=Xenopus laevis TaxID=8355 RepID=A0A974BZL0_XENLA|nr:hypothetical protein XELAEV_18044531mg [Xenopus laevis]